MKGSLKMTTQKWKAWIVAILPAFTVAAQEGFLYNNTKIDTGYVLNFPNGQEIGDQIFLSNYTTYPYLTSFSFEYYSPDASFVGTVTADVRFYLNNGPTFNGYSSPGSVFYDTGWFGIQPPLYYFPGTNSAVLSFSLADLAGGVVPLDPSMQMPSNFTMSVTFQGLSGSDSVGLNVFEPPTVGTNYGDYWFNNGGTWELLTNTIPIGFAMQFNATNQPTPEPGTLCLAAVGTALLAVFARRRRQ
jgi:hypothetical protein